METTRSMVSFDWAMKRLLRNKANFEVLEGFLSELLSRKILIRHIAESESNKTDEDDKSNRVDILVEADGRELVIIELQYDSEADYFHRMLYGTSKAVAEHIRAGDPYSEVRKVYSVNIVYFDLGKGDDYVYHGITNFTGLHTHNELELTATQRRAYGKTAVGELYPEYYIIKVRGFNDVAENTLDEWIYYLKNNRIKDGFTAQGLDMARKILAFDNLSDEDKRRYLRSIEERRIKDGEIHTALIEGEEAGLKKGEAIGLEKGEAIGEAKNLKKVIANGLRAGFSVETLSTITGLTPEEVMKMIKMIEGEERNK
ncbi:MAG: Rpn family recombination-promoting nuclease/putative transposase [Candidatus Azobacteroides sp.]|nr:Rpn family recombination-promoting nuclease/putative transposase [Candidatus Azobacteroides sp.]